MTAACLLQLQPLAKICVQIFQIKRFMLSCDITGVSLPLTCTLILFQINELLHNSVNSSILMGSGHLTKLAGFFKCAPLVGEYK